MLGRLGRLPRDFYGRERFGVVEAVPLPMEPFLVR